MGKVQVIHLLVTSYMRLMKNPTAFSGFSDRVKDRGMGVPHALGGEGVPLSKEHCCLRT